MSLIRKCTNYSLASLSNCNFTEESKLTLKVTEPFEHV